MIILYNPQSNSGRKPYVPYSLLALGALLENRHEYRIVDGNLESDPVGRIGKLAAKGADVLAVTVMPGPQLAVATEDCRQIKQRHPNLKIVWGGYFPTQHPEPCLKAPYVDFALRGHADFAFLDFIDMLHGRKAPSEVAGLAYRDSSNGTLVLNPLGPVPHPDQLPDFPFDRLPMERYVLKTCLGSRTLPYHSSYGCPFTCNFCAVVNMVEGRWAAQSAERVAAVAAAMKRRLNLNAFEFFDSNFFVSEERTAEFAERMEPLGLSWWAEGRIDTMLQFKDPTWKALVRSGLKMVFFGAESGSDEVLRRMNKGGTLTTQKTLQMAEKCKQWGIIPEFSFVLGNPPEPEKDITDTIGFIRRLKAVNPAAEIVLYMYTPVPLEGDLYAQAQDAGFKFPQTLEEWAQPHWQQVALHRPSKMPWLQRDQSQYVRDFEKVLNAYYPTATDTRLRTPHRWFLRGLSAWRYHSGIYRFPVELRAVNRLLRYQRPETAGL